MTWDQKVAIFKLARANGLAPKVIMALLYGPSWYHVVVEYGWLNRKERAA